MLALSSLVLAALSHKQGYLLSRFWVAEKSVYVLEDRSKFEPGVRVRRFVETAKGIEEVGAPVVVRDFVVGSGPGLGDSLLLLTREDRKNYKLVRVTGGAVHEISKFDSFRERVDPAIVLSESNGCIELQDPTTQGDAVSLDIWLYRDAWAGPLQTDFWDQKRPLNSLEMVSRGSRGPMFDNVLMWPNDYYRDRALAIRPATFKRGSDVPDSLDALGTLSQHAVAFIASFASRENHRWIVTVQSIDLYTKQPFQIWSPVNEALLNDIFTKSKPIFADTRGRIWYMADGKRFQRLELKKVREGALDSGRSVGAP